MGTQTLYLAATIWRAERVVVGGHTDRTLLSVHLCVSEGQVSLDEVE